MGENIADPTASLRWYLKFLFLNQQIVESDSSADKRNSPELRTGVRKAFKFMDQFQEPANSIGDSDVQISVAEVCDYNV